MAPTVTVVVPAYNLAEFLPAALDSALAQDWPADLLDVVVVDDGSTDDTPVVLERYADRVRVIRQPNGGLVRAVERGLSEVRGGYVALLDADDTWPADRLARHVAHLEAHPEVALVHGDMQLVDADGRVIAPSLFATMRPGPADGHVLGRLLAQNFVTQSAITFRASLLTAAHPLPDSVVYPDWWLAAIAASVGEIHAVPGIAAAYRRHGANMNLGIGAAARDQAQRKELPWRRWMLAHLTADPAITAAELAAAHRAFQYALVRATASADADPRGLLGATGDAAALLDRAMCESDPRLAARLLLAATAADPWDGAARTALDVALERADAMPAPAPAPVLSLQTRAQTTLATAADLVADPERLVRYAAATTADADASLVIVYAGDDELARLVELLSELGLDGDDAPDMVAHPQPATLPAQRMLEAAAS
jgi:glycosyltransferase involved in cell wall biosynthesis